MTLSTLEAMFAGKIALFHGLDCESWVQEQSRHPNPVLSLDLSGWNTSSPVKSLDAWLSREIVYAAGLCGATIAEEEYSSYTLREALRVLSMQKGKVVVLIDEYDAPLLNNIDDKERMDRIRNVLRNFYSILKSCSKFVRFIFVSGISKFNKAGVFSSLNNLEVISFDKRFSTITGYTQEELELYFKSFIDCAKRVSEFSKGANFLEKINNSYNGYSFDCIVKVYNPFSILNFFNKFEFDNYWYASGEPSFLAKYLRKKKVAYPDIYVEYSVETTFTDVADIEEARPESFLFQAGYLTLVERKDNTYILDYPNQEVRMSMAQLYQRSLFDIPEFSSLGTALWEALSNAP